MKLKKKKKAPVVVHDCRTVGYRMSSLSYSPGNDGLLHVAAHEGNKPNVGDYLMLNDNEPGFFIYRCVWVDHCYNVDPANMWMARAELVKSSEASAKLKDEVQRIFADGN